MLFEIKHRNTGDVLFSRDMSEGTPMRDVVRDAVLSEAGLRGADLRDADLRGADLRDADLRGADLRDADLRGADLYGANLRKADLRGANLRGAVLRGAVLRGANLRGAVLRGADLLGAGLRDADLCGAELCGTDLRRTDLAGVDLSGASLSGADLRSFDIPVVPNLHTRILEAIRSGGTLEMSSWHGYGRACETTHCRAGWSIHLAGEDGYALEREVGPSVAGAFIHVRSCPYLSGKVPDFLAGKAEALADIERCAELEAAGATG